MKKNGGRCIKGCSFERNQNLCDEQRFFVLSMSFIAPFGVNEVTFSEEWLRP